MFTSIPEPGQRRAVSIHRSRYGQALGGAHNAIVRNTRGAASSARTAVTTTPLTSRRQQGAPLAGCPLVRSCIGYIGEEQHAFQFTENHAGS
jgi:hypothetical protein